MVKRIVGLALLSALLLAAGWRLIHPSAPRPSCLVTVNVVGITNDASGTRQATFRVSIAGRHKVVLSPSFLLENHSGHWQTNLVPTRAIMLGTNLVGVLPFHPRLKLLAARESFEVTLSLPFDEPGWRASFWYMEIRPPLNDALRALSRRIGRTTSEDGFLLAPTDWKTQ
jgi:hypothetical protein